MNPNESTSAAGKGLATPKPSLGAIILYLTASVLMMITVFAKPLGIPVSLEGIPMLGAVLCIYFSLRLIKKAKAVGQLPPLPDAQRRKQFIIMALTLLAASASGPFWMPLSGFKFSLGTMVIISIITFVVSMGALWLGFKMRDKA